MELSTQVQTSGNGMMQVAQSREAQSVQAAMVIAQKFPRDTTRAYSRIMEDCKRKTLAEKSVYAYPRGGTTVTGPSIRLAECMARAWGNLDFGIVELERKPSMGSIPGESTVMAYCYDLETNTKSTTVFTVKHARDKNIKVGNEKKKIQELLTDERDIYEMVANLGARRLRSRILAIIPVDIVESAVEQCEKTMEGGQGPLIDRVRSLVVYFQQNHGVTQEMIEKRVGHKVEAISEPELVKLRAIANSLKDGAASREDFFEMPQSEEIKETASQVDQEQKTKSEEKKKTKSIKNFAPQNAEEAKDWQPGDHHVEEKPIDPQDERRDLIKKVITKQNEIKWDNKKLSDFVAAEFKKKTNDMSNDELGLLYDLLCDIPQQEEK